jgi:hypothetical protein
MSFSHIKFSRYSIHYGNTPEKFVLNLFVDTTGYLAGGAGDEFHFSGDFLNHSQNPLWNTALADPFFGKGSHTFFFDPTGSLIWDDMFLDPLAILNLQGGAELYVDELNASLSQFTGRGVIHSLQQ